MKVKVIGVKSRHSVVRQERFLNSECGPLDSNASGSLVAVVRGLVTSPPLLHQLALLSDFLLLMHQVNLVIP